MSQVPCLRMCQSTEGKKISHMISKLKRVSSIRLDVFVQDDQLLLGVGAADSTGKTFQRQKCRESRSGGKWLCGSRELKHTCGDSGCTCRGEGAGGKSQEEPYSVLPCAMCLPHELNYKPSSPCNWNQLRPQSWPLSNPCLRGTVAASQGPTWIFTWWGSVLKEEWQDLIPAPALQAVTVLPDAGHGNREALCASSSVGCLFESLR